MAEYKPRKLAEVDVVAEPADTANVLIEQDGEIKRAPKTAVGGGGGKPVIFRLSNDAMYSDVACTKQATVADVVDAYFANRAYFEMSSMDGTRAPQKVIGFYFSGGAYAEVIDPTDAGYAHYTQALRIGSNSDFIAAYEKYIS